MNSSQVICLGEALIDRLGPLGGDPAIDLPVDDYLGGAPANVACGLAKLGTNVAFVGCVGNDDIGQKFKSLMRSRGINISGLEINESFPSRIVLVRRSKDGDRSFQGFVRKKENLFADQAINSSFINDSWPLFSDNAKWLLIGTIPLASRISADSLWQVVEKALHSEIRIGIDVNWRPTFWDPNSSFDRGPTEKELSKILPFLENASFLKFSEEEANYFFGNNQPDIIANSLSKKPDVVVTNGPEPVKWFLNKLRGETSSIKIDNVVDTTGAGDAFMAGLIHQFLNHSSLPTTIQDMNKLVLFASACGALVCQKLGAIQSQPTKEEVESFYNSF